MRTRTRPARRDGRAAQLSHLNLALSGAAKHGVARYRAGSSTWRSGCSLARQAIARPAPQLMSAGSPLHSSGSCGLEHDCDRAGVSTCAPGGRGASRAGTERRTAPRRTDRSRRLADALGPVTPQAVTGTGGLPLPPRDSAGGANSSRSLPGGGRFPAARPRLSVDTGSAGLAADELVIEQVSPLAESVKRGSAVGERVGFHRPVEHLAG